MFLVVKLVYSSIRPTIANFVMEFSFIELYMANTSLSLRRRRGLVVRAPELKSGVPGFKFPLTTTWTCFTGDPSSTPPPHV